METDIPIESVTFTATREDAIESILSMASYWSLYAPTEAEFAAMSTERICYEEAMMRIEADRIADRMMDQAEDHWLDARFEEGFDVYSGAYTDDC